MDINIVLLIILVDISAFLAGIVAGMLYRFTKHSHIFNEKSKHKNNSDWLLLMNYYPGEPTDNLSLYKTIKGENKWKRKLK